MDGVKILEILQQMSSRLDRMEGFISFHFGPDFELFEERRKPLKLNNITENNIEPPPNTEIPLDILRIVQNLPSPNAGMLMEDEDDLMTEGLQGDVADFDVERDKSANDNPAPNEPPHHQAENLTPSNSAKKRFSELLLAASTTVNALKPIILNEEYDSIVMRIQESAANEGTSRNRLMNTRGNKNHSEKYELTNDLGKPVLVERDGRIILRPDDIYDVIQRAYDDPGTGKKAGQAGQSGHPSYSGLLRALREKYFNITSKHVSLFMSVREACKIKPSMNTPRVTTLVPRPRYPRMMIPPKRSAVRKRPKSNQPPNLAAVKRKRSKLGLGQTKPDKRKITTYSLKSRVTRKTDERTKRLAKRKATEKN